MATAIVIVGADPAAAASQVWYLDDVEFAGGGTASGTYSFDDATGTFSSPNITITDTTTLGTQTFDHLNPGIPGGATQVLAVSSGAADLTGSTGISLNLASPMTSGFASSTINPGVASVTYTCTNAACTVATPADSVSGGRVTSQFASEDDTAAATSGQTIDIPVLVNDTGGDTIGTTIGIFSAPDQGGTAFVLGNVIRYTSAPGFGGTETFQYSSISPFGPISSATVTVTVTDTAAPTPDPIQSPAANGNGWHNADVTVTWNWTDSPGSGLDNCDLTSVSDGEGDPITLSSECADLAGNLSTATWQVSVDKAAPVGAPTQDAGVVTWNWTDNLSGTDNCDITTIATAIGVLNSSCTDLAGNTSNAAIFVTEAVGDTTPPTANPTQNPAANANGWNNTDVDITWNWTDDISGTDNCPIVTTAPLAGSEGAGIDLTTTCTDVAGNTGITTYTINVDKTAPVAAPTESNGVVTWNWTDNGSGTDNCDLTTAVTDTVTSTCTDLAGNTNTETFTRPDTTPPTANPAQSPAANANGWNNTDVDIFWNWTDDVGLGGNVCPASTFVDTEGAGIAETTSCTDASGNTATATYNVNIDKTPPSSASTHSPPANANGWNNTNVDIFWNWTDDLSGTDDCPIVTNAPLDDREGAGIQLFIRCSDVAGNTGFSPPHTINIDKTPPVAAPTQSPAPNANGWNNTDVTVTWNWTDDFPGSGTDNCTISTVQSIEAGPTTVGLACFDVAGNVGVAEYQFFIDKTDPVANPTESNGIIAWNWTDALSGTDNCDTTTSPGVNGVVSSTCTDLAGNSATATFTVTSVDEEAPTAAPTQDPAANANGWNRTDVTVTWNWTDTDSGTDNCDVSTIATGQGDPVTVTSTCSDLDGNTATDTYDVRIDTEGPISAGINVDPAPNANGWHNQTVVVDRNWIDSLSGVDNTNCTARITATASSNGDMSCSDVAGNVTTESAPIRIDRDDPVANPTEANGVVTWNWSDTNSGTDNCDTTTVATVNEQVSSTCTDLAGNSATETFEVTTVPNTVPVAVDDAVTVTANRSNRIDVAANDIDPDPGDALSPAVVTAPANGTAVVDGDEIVYTPAAGFTGSDSFTYDVTDLEGDTSNTATVTVTVEAMTVVLVAGKINPPGPGDRDAILFTEQLGGFTVVLVDDDTADLRDAVLAESPGLVLLSSTTALSKVGDKLASLAVPMITWEAYLHDDNGLANTNRSAETATAANIVITDSGHPIADGLTPGSIRATTIAQKQSFLFPAGDGTSIAVSPSIPGRSVIAAWDVGDATNLGPAGARTVAFFTNYLSLDRVTDAGKTLFEQSVIWAAAGEDTASSTPNSAPAVDAGDDQDLRGPTPPTVSLDGTVSDDGLPLTPGTLVTTWSQISGPPSTIADDGAVDTTVDLTAAGVYVYELSATDGDLTTTDTVTIEFTLTGDTEILYVAGSTTPPLGDRTIVAHLESLGANVTLLNDDDAGPGMDLAPYDAVFLSTSVVISKVGDTFKDATIPVVTWEGYLFDDMGLGRSGETSTLFTTINIADPSDPLAAGLAGSPSAYTQANRLSWAVVGADADVIATQPGRANRAVLFRYQAGDTLFDSTIAAGDRYGFFANYFGAQRLTQNSLDIITAIFDELNRTPIDFIVNDTSAAPIDATVTATESDGTVRTLGVVSGFGTLRLRPGFVAVEVSAPGFLTQTGRIAVGTSPDVFTFFLNEVL